VKLWVAPLIITWAIAATSAAGYFALQAREAEVAETEDSAPTVLGVYVDRTSTRLRRRVERLHDALASALRADGESASKTADGMAAEPATSPAERVLALLDESRRLSDSDTWTMEAARTLDSQLHALLATDASTHLALMQRLQESADEDEAGDVLALLVENPFVDLVRNAEVTQSIHAAARDMLDDAQPHLRAAAPRALYGYGGATRDDVLAGLARLKRESDPTVHEELLAELSIAAKGHGLTFEEARPLIEGLRARSAARFGGWAAAALAQWSASASDFTYVATLLEEATDPRRSQEILNAFQRDTRLTGANEESARHVLLDVLEDGSRDAIVRNLALHFLRGYAPWDDETADAARRYGTD